MRFFTSVLLAGTAAAVARGAPATFSIGGGALTVDIDAATGAFAIADGSGAHLLRSGDVAVTVAGTEYSQAAATVKLTGATKLNSSDAGGHFTGMNFTWTTAGAGATAVGFETHVKLYAPGTAKTAPTSQHVVFLHHFPQAFQTGAPLDGQDGTSTAFPSLEMAAAGGRGVLSFQGDMVGSGAKTGQWLPGNGTDPVATGTCRVTDGFYRLHASGAGFDAYVPQTASKADGRTYHQTSKTFCDCTGKGECDHWAYEASGASVDDCAAACDSRNCSCFDFQAGGSGGNSANIGTGVTGSGPVVLFQESMKNTVVLSSHKAFMVGNQEFSNNTLSYGLLGSVQAVPQGFTLETVLLLHPDAGVNGAMDAWGDLLLKRGGKGRYDYRRDPATQQLGYSTDNGAYYYYQTEPNKTYEQTLLDVKAYADQEKIPYRYVLLDSWWYYKGQGGGVATWDARPDIFPHGLANFYEKTGWTGQLHNRYWSTDTPYAKQNGGQYEFVIDNSSVCVPNDQSFWDDLIANKSSATPGQQMFMYEQDWLDAEFDRSDWLKQDITAARTWLTQMNDGCQKNNVTIQMCMSHVRHVLQSTEMPAVTNARASGDYHPGSGQWDVGTTSVLAHAVGIAPSKDNYWSTAVQNGTHYGPGTAEPRSLLQSAVLSFSNGPVAPSDAVGASNASLIMRACDASGRLLTPDRPAANLDAVFAFEAGLKDPATGKPGGVNGKVWFTYAVVDGQRYGYVLVPSLDASSAPFSLTTAAMGYNASATPQLRARLLRAGVAGIQSVDASHPLVLQASTPDDPEVVVLSPVLPGGYTLLGELDKWVSVSPQRFASVTGTTGGVTAALSGAADETVTVHFATPAGAVVSGQCTLGASGTATVAVAGTAVQCK